ncbi:thio(seleno)oxazole modification radical SAM maturase SbtM [Caldimicrobium thiodismutans]|uniref:thio(seleno)oxazole modification radical SAM maturase SbtM n=1 Tax=Caldimicrobium thiodismutans TaxID=1653476 RepID=UPI000AB8AF56|nr:thio(seleno)oxazole modification radical SAM maturase SbtM [Caldimicrobium thiodismutans]
MLYFQLNPSLEISREGNEFILSFFQNATKIFIKADPWDLLVIKILIEELDPLELSKKENLTLSLILQAFHSGFEKGYLIREESKIVRKEPPFQRAFFPDDTFRVAEVFTLQWHLTNRCDLHCKHCYDRSSVSELSLEDNFRILEDFFRFCSDMKVHGQISFSGGNPFMYPHFFELYRSASEMGFSLAILGNPVSETLLERLCNIETPVYYQVSLEGLEKTNDEIRGKGHFQRTIKFLKILKDFEVPSGVMMTVHEKNLDELIPLAKYLEGRVEVFSFNRLSLFGEGKKLSPSEREKFFKVLEEYLELSFELPYLSLKDNFFNFFLYKKGLPFCGGCTGFGCGAAFNFLTLLPNGEVHACRKFPSPLGNILNKSLSEIYHSKEAELYRLGPEACNNCILYGVCRGCLAVISSFGLDLTKDKDPYCPGKLISP